jgi:hypothetical protein
VGRFGGVAGEMNSVNFPPFGGWGHHGGIAGNSLSKSAGVSNGSAPKTNHRSTGLSIYQKVCIKRMHYFACVWEGLTALVLYFVSFFLMK